VTIVDRQESRTFAAVASDADSISPALQALLQPLADRIRRVGFAHGLSEADADELLQEVRIRLWHALASGERIGSASASYVYRTAVSAALDLIRRRRARREEDLSTEAADTNPDLAAAERADQPLEESELARQVARAVDELVESRRLPVRMFLAGFRQDEIARHLGWTEPKTRNLLYRGLSDLRARLTALGVTPEGYP
jgi:RNA polymerase sigma-70 factor (ECF subfamily)